jgi:hypothetical protein
MDNDESVFQYAQYSNASHISSAIRHQRKSMTHTVTYTHARTDGHERKLIMAASYKFVDNQNIKYRFSFTKNTPIAHQNSNSSSFRKRDPPFHPTHTSS